MNSHRVRNHKTSIMFTLSVAFLFFAASSFQLLVTLVQKGYGKQIGSDIMVWAPLNMLDEQPLYDYLEGQKNSDDKLVQDFAFMSLPLNKALLLGSGAGFETRISGASQFKVTYDVAVYAVPSNYFDVVYPEYYVPVDVQDDVSGIDELPSG